MSFEAVSFEALAERAIEFAALPEPHDVASRLDRVARYGELRRLMDAAGIELGGDLAEFVDLHPDGARKLSERSPAAVLQVYAGVDGADAEAMCKVGAAVRPQTNLQGEVLPSRHEPLAAALADGGVQIARATRILSALDEIATYASPAESVTAEQLLIGESPKLTDRQFVRVCRELVERFVPDDTASREEYLRRRSGLTIHTLPDGMVRLVAMMHPEAAGSVITALDARTAPRRRPSFLETGEFVGDTRPQREQRLDALAAICRESLGHDTGKVAGTSVTVVVTMTLEALQTGLGKAKISGVDQCISAGTARRMAVDANIIPVVLGGASVALDMGREARLATEPQRRALELRDQGCSWWSCSAPPGWCEVAHIDPWSEGGATDLDNMMLLCPFHHRVFDLEGWQLITRDGVRYFVPPAWVDSAQTPRRAGPPPALAAA